MKNQQFQQTPPIDFAEITLPSAPHYCMVAPTQQATERWLKPEVYQVSVTKLEQAWQQVIAQQPRVKLLQQQANHRRYVQRSAVFRFPDIVDLEFVSVNNKQSTIYLFSRSVYGYYDLGVNCQRVKRWLHLIKASIYNES